MLMITGADIRLFIIAFNS